MTQTTFYWIRRLILHRQLYQNICINSALCVNLKPCHSPSREDLKCLDSWNLNGTLGYSAFMSGDLLSALSTMGKVCEKSTNGDLSWSHALGITDASFTKATNEAAWGQLVCGRWLRKASLYLLCSVWANGISRQGSHEHWKNVKDANIEKCWKQLMQVHFNSQDRSFPAPSIMVHQVLLRTRTHSQ